MSTDHRDQIAALDGPRFELPNGDDGLAPQQRRLELDPGGIPPPPRWRRARRPTTTATRNITRHTLATRRQADR